MSNGKLAANRAGFTINRAMANSLYRVNMGYLKSSFLPFEAPPLESSGQFLYRVYRYTSTFIGCPDNKKNLPNSKLIRYRQS